MVLHDRGLRSGAQLRAAVPCPRRRRRRRSSAEPERALDDQRLLPQEHARPRRCGLHERNHARDGTGHDRRRSGPRPGGAGAAATFAGSRPALRMADGVSHRGPARIGDGAPDVHREGAGAPRAFARCLWHGAPVAWRSRRIRGRAPPNVLESLSGHVGGRDPLVRTLFLDSDDVHPHVGLDDRRHRSCVWARHSRGRTPRRAARLVARRNTRGARLRRCAHARGIDRHGNRSRRSTGRIARHRPRDGHRDAAACVDRYDLRDRVRAVGVNVYYTESDAGANVRSLLLRREYRGSDARTDRCCHFHRLRISRHFGAAILDRMRERTGGHRLRPPC